VKITYIGQAGYLVALQDLAVFRAERDGEQQEDQYRRQHLRLHAILGLGYSMTWSARIRID
jgi:hypothetical protein